MLTILHRNTNGCFQLIRYKNNFSIKRIQEIKINSAYKETGLYLLKFGGCFSVLYFGTLLIIGLSTPENMYSDFVAHYCNFINPLRTSLLLGAKEFLLILGYSSFQKDSFTLVMAGGGGVRMVYTCIGYGVMSFWAAFIVANKGTVKKKIVWVLGGLMALWTINVLRVGLLLLAQNYHWKIPFGWDHHTWFNIIAYSFIFLLIYLYDRSNKASHL